MIENPDSSHIMSVMNDRAQGGSGYQNGRLELMINRRGYTEDHLGILNVHANKVDSNRQNLNINAQFFLKFSDSMEEA